MLLESKGSSEKRWDLSFDKTRDAVDWHASTLSGSSSRGLVADEDECAVLSRLIEGPCSTPSCDGERLLVFVISTAGKDERDNRRQELVTNYIYGHCMRKNDPDAIKGRDSFWPTFFNNSSVFHC